MQYVVIFVAIVVEILGVGIWELVCEQARDLPPLERAHRDGVKSCGILCTVTAFAVILAYVLRHKKSACGLAEKPQKRTSRLIVQFAHQGERAM